MSEETTSFPTFAIGIVIYDDFDSLDVAGPNQVFYFMKNFVKDLDIKLYIIGPRKGEVPSLDGLTWVIEHDYQTEIKLDVLFVPGGAGDGFTYLLENLNDPFYNFLKKQALSASLITCVCTGALLLARAGLLDGYTCTTHWAFKQPLSLFPGVTVAPGFPRYVIDRNRITGGGISSGIDEALAIVEVLQGTELAQEIQLTIQYAPSPSIKSGDPAVASPTTLYTVSNRIDITDTYNLIKSLLKNCH